MKHMQIEIFNAITETHNQFHEPTLLFPAIQKTLNCTKEKAEGLAATHCNLISCYSPCRSKGLYNKEYSEFFKDCLNSKYVTKQGYITDKPALFDYLKIETPLTTYRDFEDIVNPLARLNPDKFYQVKVFAKTKGDHFMSTYIKSGVLYLSDTNNRGIGVPALDHITQKNFQKITEIV